MYVIQKIHKISTVEKNPKSGKQGHSIAQGPAEELKNYMHQQRGREAAGGLKRRKKKKAAKVVHSGLSVIPKCVFSHFDNIA